uniref:uncharacterized protein LOC122610906 n=1 Tax=Erigeron canadensis TaxID=72917 RepID=UPI001CB984C7|nr:uncharacterized protein LOC122610906 [Erigeron canadensis]
MASTPASNISTPKLKKRIPKNPKNNSNKHSSSPSSFLQTLSSIEPPPNLFPSEFFKLIAVVSIAVSVAIGCNYAVNYFIRPPNPFCDNDIEFDYHNSDVCDPCPNHGICSEGKMECMSGYRRHGRLCLEDGYFNELVKNLAKRAEVRACESYSQYLCNGIGEVWIQGNALWDNIDNDNANYLYAKQKAMEIVGSSLETRDTSIGIKELKCPDSLVVHYKPLSCCIRLWLMEHALSLVPFCALLVGFGLLLQRVRRRHYLSVRAEELYEQVCDMLEETALASGNVNGEGEPWIVASWLRDHILTPKERRDPMLWKKVEELVQEDSRLDRYPKILKGEPKVVWEWQVEGALRSSGKKKTTNVTKQRLREESKLASNEDRKILKPRWPFKC